MQLITPGLSVPIHEGIIHDLRIHFSIGRDGRGHFLPGPGAAMYRALVEDWLDRIEHPDA